MDDQVFADGIGTIMVVSGTVRIDLVSYSPTELDSKGRPTTTFRQRIIMSTEGFLQAADKFREAAQAINERGLAERQRNEAPAPRVEAPTPVQVTAPAPESHPAPEPAQPRAVEKHPFP